MYLLGCTCLTTRSVQLKSSEAQMQMDRSSFIQRHLNPQFSFSFGGKKMKLSELEKDANEYQENVTVRVASHLREMI